jgi:hypothetical protein
MVRLCTRVARPGWPVYAGTSQGREHNGLQLPLITEVS